MCGMMGLAVDLGWSYFVQKQAQTSADGAALAAVQEAYARMKAGGIVVTGFSCTGGSAGTGATQVECQPTAPGVVCGSVTATSNLNNGCLYAKVNGFDWASSRQKVTLQSNSYNGVDPSLLPPTAPGVLNISYWVTARTVQTIPQLFSAVFNNTEGTVSAVATAAIAGSITPGSFFGMNRRGDCFADSSGTSHCGTDVVGGTGVGGFPQCGALKADLCAPAGIILASNCDGQTIPGECDQGYAGVASKPMAASSLLIMQDGGHTGTVNPPADWVDLNGNPITPRYASAASGSFDDVFPGKQPPIMTAANAMGSCGIPARATDTVANVGTQNQPIGPFLYYSYRAGDSSHTPTGLPISFNQNVTFSATASCPAGSFFTAGGTQTSSNFPTYVFYGGVQVSATMNLGPGQYVMAGTKNTAPGATVLNMTGNSSVIRPDPGQGAAINTGTMFIFTDSNYPGLNLPNTFPALNQGTLNVKNGDVNMYGVVSGFSNGGVTPSEMNAYSGIVWWQDRRNSVVGYEKDFRVDPSGCASASDCQNDDGDVIYCKIGCLNGNNQSTLANMLAANHVTATSPGVIMDPGNGNIALHGAFYQPRGAWLEFVHGTTGFSCGSGSNAFCPLQVVTGALVERNGDTGLLLAGPTNPIQTFKPTLIH